MASATLIAPLASGITGAASGTAEFYERGTNTPLYVYSDDAATVVLGKTVTLDANGGVTAYATKPALVRVRNSSGVVVREFTAVTGDNDVDVASPSFTGLLATGSQGAGGLVDLNTVLNRWYASAKTLDFKVLRTGLTTPQTLQDAFAAVASSNQPFFNVANYGASGDGVTVNDAAFKAAHDAAVAAGGGIILVPGGSFILGAAFSITSQKVSMWGFGAKASVIVSGLAAGVAVTVNAGAATFGGASIQDLTVTAFSSGANVTPLQVVSTPGLLLRNVCISGFALAADIQSRVVLAGCDWTTPNSATAGDYVAKFSSNASDSLVLGGSYTQSRATNTGGLSLGVNNIAVVGAKVDISALSGAGYGVDAGAANCKVESCDLITGVAATYAMRVNGDFSFTENNNSFAGSGRPCLLSSSLSSTTRVVRGSRPQKFVTQNASVTGTTTVTLDPDFEIQEVIITASASTPVLQFTASPSNLVHHGMRLIVLVNNTSANTVSLAYGGTGFLGAPYPTISTNTKRMFEFIYRGPPNLAGGSSATGSTFFNLINDGPASSY